MIWLYNNIMHEQWNMEPIATMVEHNIEVSRTKIDARGIWIIMNNRNWKVETTFA